MRDSKLDQLSTGSKAIFIYKIETKPINIEGMRLTGAVIFRFLIGNFPVAACQVMLEQQVLLQRLN